MWCFRGVNAFIDRLSHAPTLLSVRAKGEWVHAEHCHAIQIIPLLSNCRFYIETPAAPGAKFLPSGRGARGSGHLGRRDWPLLSSASFHYTCSVDHAKCRLLGLGRSAENNFFRGVTLKKQCGVYTIP